MTVTEIPPPGRRPVFLFGSVSNKNLYKEWRLKGNKRHKETFLPYQRRNSGFSGSFSQRDNAVPYSTGEVKCISTVCSIKDHAWAAGHRMRRHPQDDLQYFAASMVIRNSNVPKRQPDDKWHLGSRKPCCFCTARDVRKGAAGNTGRQTVLKNKV